MEEQMRAAFSNVNWKRIRVGLLKRSVPVPVPVFFLIFLLVSWASFTLYLKLEQVSRMLEILENRTSSIETHLSDPSQEGMSEDDGEYADPPATIIEM